MSFYKKNSIFGTFRDPCHDVKKTPNQAPLFTKWKRRNRKISAIVGKFGGDRERSEDFLRTVGACRQLRP